MEIRNKTILILGLGGYEQGSGVSAALFCVKRGAKKVIVTDLKTAEQIPKTVRQLKKYRKIELRLGKHALRDIERADLIVKNPGVPDDSEMMQYAHRLGKEITNDIGLFLAFKPEGVVIGVTGTRGKSTTTTLIYELLKAHSSHTFFGGNIGVSPLQFVDTMREGDITVLELSSWMLHNLQPQLDIAVVTNILPDHLNRYRSMQHYQKDKERIWKFQQPNQYIVLNAENHETRSMGKHAPAHVCWFGGNRLAKDMAVVSAGYITVAGKRVCSVKNIQLLGKHNMLNVLAAVAVAKLGGVPNTKIVRVLKSFRGVPNRLEFIREVGGVKYYNDTTATSPDATIAALQAFNKKIILIGGGNSKGLDLRPLAQLVAKKTKLMILLEGNANDVFRKVLPKTRYMEAAEMDEAVAYAAQVAKRGDIVMLSPGCTWLPKMNEFERGKQFVKTVQAL
ncbi:MAG: UDP-N-acetylmuramoyl-L-alanine--D-glutamate ligase [Candidatus Kerfeldbacteria bacterium]|nr:UDP-N-acetylmuramoyl-L-alanine--D-glutamate ligase [Candidatus Kerfeldbacteria bacterium]